MDKLFVGPGQLVVLHLQGSLLATFIGPKAFKFQILKGSTCEVLLCPDSVMKSYEAVLYDMFGKVG